MRRLDVPYERVGCASKVSRARSGLRLVDGMGSRSSSSSSSCQEVPGSIFEGLEIGTVVEKSLGMVMVITAWMNWKEASSSLRIPFHSGSKNCIGMTTAFDMLT